MRLHGQWEREHTLVDPNELGSHSDGYLFKNTDIIFLFPIVVTFVPQILLDGSVICIPLQANLIFPSA